MKKEKFGYIIRKAEKIGGNKMWTFKEMKEKARFRLLSNYTKCLFAMIIFNAISNLLSFVLPVNGNIAAEPMTEEKFLEIQNAVSNNMGLVFSIIAGIFMVSILFSVFIMSPITVGKVRFFNETARDSSKIKELFFSFTHGIKSYFNIVRVEFIKAILIAIWVLPGMVIMAGWFYWVSTYSFNLPLASLAGTIIIMISMILVLRKSLEYFFVDYILADEPDISWKMAKKMSKEMTKGQKISILALQFSFIGWYILGLAFGGFGLIFILPYVEMTFSELYLYFKDKKSENMQENEQNERENA